MSNDSFRTKSLTCECGKVFTSSASLVGHYGHCKVHLGEDRYNKIRSEAAVKLREGHQKYVQEQRDIKEQKDTQLLIKWLADEHKCEFCGKIMTSKYASGRFCDEQCYRKFVAKFNSEVRFKDAKRNDTYRALAFRHYSHKCAVCGYKECVDILEVHHKDGDRNNNALDNLVILCPNCHKKITLKLFVLLYKDNRYILIKC